MQSVFEVIRAFGHILLAWKFHDDISNGSRVIVLTIRDTQTHPPTNGHYWKQSPLLCYHCMDGNWICMLFVSTLRMFNALERRNSYSATSNNLKLVHSPLMGGLLHLVQQGGDWVGPQPAQDPPLAPHVSKFCLKEWQDIWDACQGNKLYAIYPNVDKVVHSCTASKYRVIKPTVGGYQYKSSLSCWDPVLINRLWIGHTRLSYSYQLSGWSTSMFCLSVPAHC